MPRATSPKDWPPRPARHWRNIVALLAEAGADPSHIVRLTWWVTDLDAYRDQQLAIGAAYRRALGKHFPAMSLLGVTGLAEPSALVEIEATAVVPDA